MCGCDGSAVATHSWADIAGCDEDRQGLTRTTLGCGLEQPLPLHCTALQRSIDLRAPWAWPVSSPSSALRCVGTPAGSQRGVFAVCRRAPPTAQIQPQDFDLERLPNCSCRCKEPGPPKTGSPRSICYISWKLQAIATSMLPPRHLQGLPTISRPATPPDPESRCRRLSVPPFTAKSLGAGCGSWRIERAAVFWASLAHHHPGLWCGLSQIHPIMLAGPLLDSAGADHLLQKAPWLGARSIVRRSRSQHAKVTMSAAAPGSANHTMVQL